MHAIDRQAVNKIELLQTHSTGNIISGIAPHEHQKDTGTAVCSSVNFLIKFEKTDDSRPRYTHAK